MSDIQGTGSCSLLIQPTRSLAGVDELFSPRRVLTYGTYDTMHWGHINLLRRAKELAHGGELFVALSTDEFNEVKGKKAYHDFETRLKMLTAIKYVDQVIPELCWEQKLSDVEKFGIECVVMGNDWAGSEYFEILRDYCDLVFLPRTELISSSNIRRYILQTESY
ncbi:MAG: adenylyltransferase/cytidyltransferase family protein [Coriobacteriales bacterium]|jgi:choline-phosphate cytidylyltransferase/glycerol-3-phosphate cytidylyltransferase|nr:adenylyltransferase/cytidyltransferase family protein [Coriobacteriales bacterium]